MDIKIANLLSANQGELPSHTSDVDYPLYYLTKDNRILCPMCANAILKGTYRLDHIKADDIVDFQINWDNYDLTCFGNHAIETATIELEYDEEEIDIGED